jgi:tight adherence protein C
MPSESIELFRNAAFLVISFLTVATLYMLVSPILEGDKRKKRMNSVANARDNLKQKRKSELSNKNVGLRSEGKGFTKRLVDRFSLERLLETSDIKDKLAQAGMRGQSPIYTFYVFRLAMPIVLLFVGLILFVGLNVREWSLVQNVFATLCMTLFGLYLPGIYVKNVAGKRLNAIIPVFPDALDLLLICVESGMSVELAFGRVSEEMADSSIELAEEFSITTAELSYLSSRRMAYENFARRNNHPGIKAVSTALIQAERYGTPLGDTLRTMANENRQMRVMQAEKKAASLPAKLTVPMILFFLPVLFIVILTPAALRLGNALG